MDIRVKCRSCSINCCKLRQLVKGKGIAYYSVLGWLKTDLSRNWSETDMKVLGLEQDFVTHIRFHLSSNNPKIMSQNRPSPVFCPTDCKSLSYSNKMILLGILSIINFHTRFKSLNPLDRPKPEILGSWTNIYKPESESDWPEIIRTRMFFFL